MITQPNITRLIRCLIIIAAYFGTLTAFAAKPQYPLKAESCELRVVERPRFVKLNQQGLALAEQKLNYKHSAWSCVLDRRTQLVWEVKSTSDGLHNNTNRYTWFNPQNEVNGGFIGYKNRELCQQSACDTWSYIQALNKQSLCSSKHWRLPNREELRSLIRYDTPYPGPTVERQFFPNTMAQYYWSGSPASDDRDSAWGIGFSFGFDYAYFKSHAGYVRAVFSNQDSGPN